MPTERPVVTAPAQPSPLPRPALDSHTHLDMVDLPVSEVVASARTAGIVRIVTVGTDLESSRWSVRCADEHDGVYATVAIHPNETQAVSDAKTLLTPFLPRSSQAVHEMLGGTGSWSGMPRLETVDEAGGPSYPVITGDYDDTFRWHSRPVAAGTPLAVPAPLFTKLDTSVVDEEIARLAEPDSADQP